jgi:hypothetical protein
MTIILGGTGRARHPRQVIRLPQPNVHDGAGPRNLEHLLW